MFYYSCCCCFCCCACVSIVYIFAFTLNLHELLNLQKRERAEDKQLKLVKRFLHGSLCLAKKICMLSLSAAHANALTSALSRSQSLFVFFCLVTRSTAYLSVLIAAHVSVIAFVFCCRCCCCYVCCFSLRLQFYFHLV